MANCKNLLCLNFYSFYNFKRSLVNRFKINKAIPSNDNIASVCTSSFVQNYESEGNKTKSREIADLINFAKSDPNWFKKGCKTLLRECRKFYEEQKGSRYVGPLFRIREPNDELQNIDIIFKFETNKDLALFSVTTDKDNNGGFSTASLKISENKTALFTGNLCTTVPKNSNVDVSGYVNLMCFRKLKSFFRPSYYDWSGYTHLVLKVRGDGRPWGIILATPLGYSETFSYQFCHPLYTRGGPYWQITKIPFSHFFFSKKGKIAQKNEEVPLKNIARIGFTLADNRDGPFKLEIDYIGLECVPFHNDTSPYENYYKPVFIA